jgi:hypothetical protein
LNITVCGEFSPRVDTSQFTNPTSPLFKYATGVVLISVNKKRSDMSVQGIQANARKVI